MSKVHGFTSYPKILSKQKESQRFIQSRSLTSRGWARSSNIHLVPRSFPSRIGARGFIQSQDPFPSRIGARGFIQSQDPFPSRYSGGGESLADPWVHILSKILSQQKQSRRFYIQSKILSQQKHSHEFLHPFGPKILYQQKQSQEFTSIWSQDPFPAEAEPGFMSSPRSFLTRSRVRSFHIQLVQILS